MRSYTKMHIYFTEMGFKPNTHWLDNEAFEFLKIYDRDNTVYFQLVPPYMHSINAAESSIITCKNHFVSGLSGTYKVLQMHLWDRLLN